MPYTRSAPGVVRGQFRQVLRSNVLFFWGTPADSPVVFSSIGSQGWEDGSSSLLASLNGKGYAASRSFRLESPDPNSVAITSFLGSKGVGLRSFTPGIYDPVNGLGDTRFVAQTDAFYISCDVQGLATATLIDVRVGFRKAGRILEDTATYTDHYLAKQKDDTGMKWGVNTLLNNAGAVDELGSNAVAATNSTWYKLRIEVLATGVASMKVDGTAQADLTEYTFDSGDILIPEVQFGENVSSGASTGDTLLFRNLEVGTL
jgi:hypothetical protein